MLVQHTLEICAKIDIPPHMFWWAALLILLLGGAVVAWALVRRFFNTNRGNLKKEPTFTLESVRKMYDSGQITEEEYKHLRDTIINHTSF